MKPFTVVNLKRIMVSKYGFSWEEITGPRRYGPLVNARHIAIFIAVQKIGLGFQQVGDLFGGRDRTTISHAYSKIKNLVKEEKLDLGVFNNMPKLTVSQAITQGNQHWLYEFQSVFLNYPTETMIGLVELTKKIQQQVK